MSRRQILELSGAVCEFGLAAGLKSGRMTAGEVWQKLRPGTPNVYDDIAYRIPHRTAAFLSRRGAMDRGGYLKNAP
jgi:hypothetical protein